MPPPAYNKGIHEALVSAERAGLSRRACAGHAGINWRTYLRWLEKGGTAAAARDEGEEVLADYVQYEALFRDVERARAEWEKERIEALQDDELKQYWTKEAWQLERKLPDEYSLTTTVRHEGEIEHSTRVELTPEQKKELMEGFAKIAAPKGLPRGNV